MTEVLVRDVDVPDFDGPIYQEPRDSAPGEGEYRCEVCTTPISTPSGRKPRVMLCEEHRGRGTPAGPGTGKSSKSHAYIAQQMAALHDMLGFGVGAVYLINQNPVWLKDKSTIGAHSENIGEAWAKMCDSDPKMKQRVQKFLEMAGTMSLAAAYAPVAFSVMQNHSGTPTSSPAPQQAQQVPGMGV